MPPGSEKRSCDGHMTYLYFIDHVVCDVLFVPVYNTPVHPSFNIQTKHFVFVLCKVGYKGVYMYMTRTCLHDDAIKIHLRRHNLFIYFFFKRDSDFHTRYHASANKQ